MRKFMRAHRPNRVIPAFTASRTDILYLGQIPLSGVDIGGLGDRSHKIWSEWTLISTPPPQKKCLLVLCMGSKAHKNMGMCASYDVANCDITL